MYTYRELEPYMCVMHASSRKAVYLYRDEYNTHKATLAKRETCQYCDCTYCADTILSCTAQHSTTSCCATALTASLPATHNHSYSAARRHTVSTHRDSFHLLQNPHLIYHPHTYNETSTCKYLTKCVD